MRDKTASGCGKTTLLFLLGGLEKPQKGSILFHGKNIEEIGYENYRRNHVAFVFQNYNLIPYMTAKENVELVAADSVMETLKSVGIEEEDTNFQRSLLLIFLIPTKL